MRVEVAVPEIVDCAACTAHDEGAGEKECGSAEYGERRRHGGCEGRGEQRREEAWEEEIVGAGGLVEADEFGVWNPGGGEMGEEAGFGRRVWDGEVGLGFRILRRCL